MRKIKSRNWRIKRNKLFRWFGFMVIVVGIFYCSSYVEAGMNDSLIEKNRVDNVYAITNINGISRIFYLNMYEMNDRISYCIDIGVDITSSIYHSTNDFAVSYLDDEKIDYIRGISYFGYGYKDHNDYKYYMASQELIWEYLDNVEVEWSNEMKVDGNRIDIESFKRDILNLKYEYDKKVSFDISDGQVFTVGDDIILSDNNKVLSDYDVVVSKYSETLIDGNNLNIKVGNTIGKEEINLKRKGYYGYDSQLYYYDNSQRLISSGDYKNDNEVLNFDIKGVSLVAKVIQSSDVKGTSVDASLEGAKYELYDKKDNLIGVYETGSDGKFKISNLVFGEYYIKQIKESRGYILNKKLVNLVVDSDNQEIVLEQDLILNSFELKKFYGSNGNYMPEALITFLVYNSDGSFRYYLTTDLDGIETFRLPYGQYKVKQNNSTSGYKKVDDFIIEVSQEKALNDITYYNLIDELIKIKLKVNNYEQISGEKILGTGFSYRIRIKGTDSYVVSDGKSIFEVDKNGYLSVPEGLSYGSYVLEQVSTPEGILLNEIGIEVDINDHSNFFLVDGDLVMEINMYNELIMGRVNVLASEERFYKKNNEYGYELIKRVNNEFKLIAKEDVIVNGKIMHKVGDEVVSGITDENGNLVLDNLYLGNYCLIDSNNEEEKCFVLKSKYNNTKIVEEEVEFISVLDKRNIMIRNISSSGNSIFGSLFELVDDQGMVIYNGVSNEDGIVKIENIWVDNYCIRQKKVDDNYLLNKEKICFLLEEDQIIDFINEEVVGEVINVPNTLSESVGYYEVILILVLVGTGIFVYKKIFSSKLYR